MPTTRQSLAKSHAKSDTGLNVEMAFARSLSNLTHALRSASEACYGGLSLSVKSDGRWFAVARGLDTELECVCAFGSGSTPWDALREVNATIARGKWKPDGFAREKGLGPSDLHKDALLHIRDKTNPT